SRSRVPVQYLRSVGGCHGMGRPGGRQRLLCPVGKKTPQAWVSIAGSSDEAARVPKQALRNPGEEDFHRRWLLEQRFVVPQGRPVLEQLAAKTGQINHLNRWLRLADELRELVTAHARHDEIDQQQVDRCALFGEPQRLDAVSRNDRLVARAV